MDAGPARVGAGGYVPACFGNTNSHKSLEVPMAFSVPALPYAFDALEPAIDAQTMEIHHGKHHAAYVAKLNAAVEGLTVPDCINKVISDLSQIPEAKRGAVRNNGGGHANHSLFWKILAPVNNGGGGTPGGDLGAAINSDLGGFDKFKTAFADAAANRFGSGWAWLVVKGGKLAVCSTANQDNPRMGQAVAGCDGTPILGLDVWEHAYYLKYQNRRPDYINAFFSVVNWAQVAENYKNAKA
jgi:Fe-Mn family superoxide dismutase